MRGRTRAPGGPAQPGLNTRWPSIKCFFILAPPYVIVGRHRCVLSGAVESPHTQVAGMRHVALFYVITDVNDDI